MKKALYLVTGCFADAEPPEVRECYIIHDGGEGQVLVYHPCTAREKKEGFCDSVEICMRQRICVNGKWHDGLRSIKRAEDAYVNLGDDDVQKNKTLAKFIGKKQSRVVGKHKPVKE